MKGTRRDVLLQLEHWLTDEQDKRVFWLNGLAGTGKSTIAQTFAEMSFADGKLGASFFCSRDFEERSNLRTILPTLAFQLAHRYPDFRQVLLPILAANPDVGRESLCSQMEKLIVGPLKATRTWTLVIIDALDECRDEEPASALLSVLSRYVDKIPLVKFFITGRPEPRIRSGFRLELLQPHTDVLRLHDVKPNLVDSDIKLFLTTRLTDIIKNRSNCSLMGDWPSPQDINVLCKKAAGFFIYASTVVKFVMSRYHSPGDRLALIISLPQDTSHEGRSGIDLLYTRVLEQAFCDVDQDFYPHFKSVVGAVLLIFHPLSIKALSNLLGNCGTPSRIYNALHVLHSLLLIPDNMEDPVRIFHKSFPDFLMDPGRCTDHRFLIDPSIYHRDVLFSCLNVMKGRLKKNICELDNYVSLSKVEDLPARRAAYIGDVLGYACCFWTGHLVGITSSNLDVKEVQEAIEEFFATNLLFWIEALSIMGNLDVGVSALNDIQQWCMLVSYTHIYPKKLVFMVPQAGVPYEQANDSQRFLLEHFDTIHKSPSHLYHSALPLCPASSWLQKCYNTEHSKEVKVIKGLPAEWGRCLRTVPFEYYQRALVCQKDLIAVGSDSGRIVIFSAITGIQTSALGDRSGAVCALAFSFDGTLLVSGTHDGIILWDIQTGGAIKTFHTDSIYPVSISSDRTIIASGSNNGVIHLWDTQTGEHHCVIDGHGDRVNSINFSPTNSQLLISASNDHTVRQWDINGHQIGSIYEGDCVAFSSDGAYFVSCSGENATIRNSSSGMVVFKLQASGNTFQCCCFSPNGRFVAGGAGCTIYIWNITSSDPHLIEAFVGHSDKIISLAFSSSLISSSDGGPTKFWDISALSTNAVATDLVSTQVALTSIRSISLQAASGIVISIDLAGVMRIWDISTGLCTASFHTTAQGNGHGDMQVINGRLILVWQKDREIQIWDVEKEEHLRSLQAPQFPWDSNLRISGDGSKVLLLDGGYIWAWSIWTGQVVSRVQLAGQVSGGFLFVDGSKIWVYFKDAQTLGWDFGISDSTPIPLSHTSPDRPHLGFIRGDMLDDPSGIKDIVTGNEVFWLSGRYANPTTTQWDGQYLAAGYGSGEILILDFNHKVSQ